MTRIERLELNRLSKVVYGKTSVWQKMLKNGEVGPQIEKMEDGTERKYKGITYSTLDQIKTTMQELEVEELELKANQEKEALEQAKKNQENFISENFELMEEMAIKNQQDFGVDENIKDVIKEILETVES